MFIHSDFFETDNLITTLSNFCYKDNNISTIDILSNDKDLY